MSHGVHTYTCANKSEAQLAMAEKEAAEGSDLVQVTPEMVRAGLEELRDLVRSGDDDKARLVAVIYTAMEYERREATRPTLLLP
jgi:hypothetical protein